ncbi:MAG: hypothetical protein ACPGWM_09120 [Flavobacteriales bacterium]
MEQIQEVKQKTILVVGRHDYIVENITKILQPNGFNVLSSTADEEVLKILKSQEVDVLFIGGAVEPNSRVIYTSFLAQNGAKTKYVEHYGGPATILSEIQEALTQ